MNNSTPKVTKESKNKIKVDFDRTPLKERLKAKFVNTAFVQNVVIKIFRFIFLLGIAYVVLYPFFTKIASSFMSREDLVDVTVRLIPKNFSLDIYKMIWRDGYIKAFTNTLLISLMCAVLQTFACCMISYGLAKYKFKGNNLVFILVVITMLIPHRTLQAIMSVKFTHFDILGIFSFLSGGASVGIDSIDEILSSIHIMSKPEVQLTGTLWPLVILSVTGLAFKNGLYIFMLRQFFRGIPDSLEESAYIDGSGDFRTFIQIILPMSVPMMITVFLFAFCWQWTDNFYVPVLVGNTANTLQIFSKWVNSSPGVKFADMSPYPGLTLYQTAFRNAAGIMLILPLVIMYVFLQRYLVEGIERSGLTAE